MVTIAAEVTPEPLANHLASAWCVEKDHSFSRDTTAASVDDDVPLVELQKNACEKDLESRTRSVTAERCSLLQFLATDTKAHRVLDVSSRCGVASLALAEVIPVDGDIQALESDKNIVEFGKPFISKSPVGAKITTHIGNPLELIAQFVHDKAKPFDLVLINAGADMRKCFDLIWQAELLSADGMICIDMNMMEESEQLSWEAVVSSPDKVALDYGGLKIVQRSCFPGVYA